MARFVLSLTSSSSSNLPPDGLTFSRSRIDEPALAIYYQSAPIPETFEPGIIVASVLVSILGSYATLLLLGKRTSIRGTRNLILLLAASITFGVVGVWSMHFVSSFSARPFSLPLPLLPSLSNRLSSPLLPSTFAALGIHARSTTYPFPQRRLVPSILPRIHSPLPLRSPRRLRPRFHLPRIPSRLQHMESGPYRCSCRRIYRSYAREYFPPFLHHKLRRNRSEPFRLQGFRAKHVAGSVCLFSSFSRSTRLPSPFPPSCPSTPLTPWSSPSSKLASQQQQLSSSSFDTGRIGRTRSLSVGFRRWFSQLPCWECITSRWLERLGSSGWAGI